MPIEFSLALSPEIVEEAIVLLAKLGAAATELAAIRCGLANDDFVQRVFDMNLMNADEADCCR
jgi:hypothetical protein